MSDADEKPCSNCSRPQGPGSAKDLCGRCYQAHRRTGKLPPRELAFTGDLEARLTLRLSPADLKDCKAAAKREGLDLSDWARAALTFRARMGLLNPRKDA